MNIRKAVTDQLENTQPITTEMVDSIVENAIENETKRTEGEIREQYPIGDRLVYALIERPALEDSDFNISLEIVRVLESEFEEFDKNHEYVTTGDNHIPRFKEMA